MYGISPHVFRFIGLTQQAFVMPARRGGLGGGAGEGGGGARGGLGGDGDGGGGLGGDRGGGGGLKVHHRQTGSQWLIWRLSQLPWGAND